MIFIETTETKENKMTTQEKLSKVLESINHHKAWLDQFGWDVAGSGLVKTCLNNASRRAEKLTAQLKAESKK